MTIPTITEYLGVVPDRRSQSAEAFTQAAISWTDYQADTFIPSINTTVESMNLAVIAVDDNTALAEDAAATASSSANYQGDWFIGAAALKGQSWSHNGFLWRAKQNSVVEPTEGAFWLLINAAKTISTKTSESTQDFIDSFAFKIFQSPTDGLTEIQTRTLFGGDVYEVRKASDDSFADIYIDKEALIPIPQDGTSNVSGSDGVVEFFIDDGDYYVEVDSIESNFAVYNTVNTPEINGAYGTGVTLDNAAIARAIAKGRVFSQGEKIYLLDNLQGNISIEGLKIKHTGNSQPLTPTIGFKGERVVVESSYHGIQSNSVINDFYLNNAKIDAQRFGVLLNTGWNGSENAKIINSTIISDEADAIEVNSVGGDSKYLYIAGNTVSGGVNGASSLSGFGIGMAELNHTVTTGNISTGSRSRGYHTEACDRGNLIVGNLYLNNQQDGMFLQPVKEGEVQEAGIQSLANYIEATSGNTGIGIRFTFRTAAEGSYKKSLSVGDYIKGFETGITAPNGELVVIDNAIIDTSTSGVICSGDSSAVVGTQVTNDVDTPLKSSDSACFDTVHSITTPVDILSPTSTSTKVGASVKNFSFPMQFVNTGVGAQEFNQLFAIGRVFRGRVNVKLYNSNNFFFVIVDLSWDGTTLTIDQPVIRHTAGNIFGTFNFQENAGFLEMSFASASAINATGRVEFEGVYYRHTV